MNVAENEQQTVGVTAELPGNVTVTVKLLLTCVGAVTVWKPAVDDAFKAPMLLLRSQRGLVVFFPLLSQQIKQS